MTLSSCASHSIIDGDIVEIVEKDHPGPMDYQMHPALGRQVLSNKRNGIMVLLKGRVKEVKEYGTKPIGPMTYHVPADRGSKASKKTLSLQAFKEIIVTFKN